MTVDTAYRLDDNEWHSVLVERNRKEAMIVVDGARKGSVKEPIGPVSAFQTWIHITRDIYQKNV